MASPTLLVLAAGMGSRYGGLKQIDPMGPNGETVLDYSVLDALRAGFGRVLFVIREDFADVFREGIGSRFEGKIQVDYAFQSLDDLPNGFSVPTGRTKPWGTAHAIRAARSLIDGPFAVINADDFYGRDAYRQAVAFIKKCAALPQAGEPALEHFAMIGYPLLNTLSEHGEVNRGICEINADGQLTDVEEIVRISRQADGILRGYDVGNGERQLAGEDLVSMNFWIFTAGFMPLLEQEFIRFLNHHGQDIKSECYIPTVVDAMIRKQQADCTVLETSSSWFGVTYPQDKPHVVASIQALIAAGEYPA